MANGHVERWREERASPDDQRDANSRLRAAAHAAEQETSRVRVEAAAAQKAEQKATALVSQLQTKVAKSEEALKQLQEGPRCVDCAVAMHFIPTEEVGLICDGGSL